MITTHRLDTRWHSPKVGSFDLQPHQPTAPKFDSIEAAREWKAGADSRADQQARDKVVAAEVNTLIGQFTELKNRVLGSYVHDRTLDGHEVALGNYVRDGVKADVEISYDLDAAKADEKTFNIEDGLREDRNTTASRRYVDLNAFDHVHEARALLSTGDTWRAGHYDKIDKDVFEFIEPTGRRILVHRDTAGALVMIDTPDSIAG